MCCPLGPLSSAPPTGYEMVSDLWPNDISKKHRIRNQSKNVCINIFESMEVLSWHGLRGYGS